MRTFSKHFADDDVILIGDFNMGNVAEPAAKKYVAAGLLDLNARDLATHISGKPLDRCYVPASQRKAGKEFAKCRLEILAPPANDRFQFRRVLSDHWPIVIDLVDMEDDD